jgi:hypothetical protein
MVEHLTLQETHIEPFLAKVVTKCGEDLWVAILWRLWSLQTDLAKGQHNPAPAGIWAIPGASATAGFRTVNRGLHLLRRYRLTPHFG